MDDVFERSQSVVYGNLFIFSVYRFRVERRFFFSTLGLFSRGEIMSEAKDCVFGGRQNGERERRIFLPYGGNESF